MSTVKTCLLVACCSVVLWSAVAAHAVILDNGLVENGLVENGLVENGLVENGRTEKPMGFNQTCAMRNGDNGRSTDQSEGLSFHGLSQKGLGKKQP